MKLKYDGIYQWKGWGGKLQLGSGSCRLRIFDLEKDDAGSLTHLRPIILVVSDVPESTITIRSCPGHIATGVAEKFNIAYQRMTYVEYYPATVYGDKRENIIAERFDAVEFTWQKGRAHKPKWRPLKAPMLEMVKRLMREFGSPATAE